MKVLRYVTHSLLAHFARVMPRVRMRVYVDVRVYV